MGKEHWERLNHIRAATWDHRVAGGEYVYVLRVKYEVIAPVQLLRLLVLFRLPCQHRLFVLFLASTGSK
jgi:hypothetical protein